jgi:hypothetical protein
MKGTAAYGTNRHDGGRFQIGVTFPNFSSSLCAQYGFGYRAEIASRDQEMWLEYETVIKIDLPHLDDQVEARQVEALSDRQIVS